MFFDLLSKFQSRRIDDQRCSFKPTAVKPDGKDEKFKNDTGTYYHQGPTKEMQNTESIDFQSSFNNATCPVFLHVGWLIYQSPHLVQGLSGEHFTS